ncbi:MAG: OmpA family protein [Pseudomonadota bacterium]
MRLRATALSIMVSVLAGPAAALGLELPGEADLTREVVRAADTYFLPVAPFSAGAVPAKELEGRVVRQAWRITDAGLSTLDLLSAIREQMRAQGYEILLDCTAPECGGFDFRFGIDVLPAPDMFVDLFDFRFLAAQNPDAAGAQYVSALVSRGGEAGYVQIVVVGSDTAPIVAVPTPVINVSPDPAPQPGSERDSLSLPETLMAQGHVVLPDLVFTTGSSALEEGQYASLSELAAFLKQDAERRVVLVGHTDAVGSLEDNVALSRARAASVLERLVEDHGVAEAQVTSEGMGYLSPVAPNTTEAGRHANRRVEAVLLNTR